MTEHVVFLDRSTLVADIRPPAFEHTWTEYPTTEASEIEPRARDKTIVITNKVPITADVLDHNPSIKLIAVAATGVNNIDLDACQKRGVTVSNIRDYAARSVPEHVFALILALSRNLLALSRDVRSGAWARANTFCLLNHRINDLAGSTLGIVGLGSIGEGTRRIASGFGMDVLVAERPGQTIRPGRASFDEVLERSDVLSLHCPLTDENHHLIGRDALAKMKPTAILINTARGQLVDDLALKEALLSGKLGGAGIDVLEEEPPLSPNPLLELDLPNLIVTPHVAWASREAMQTLADQLIDNIEAFMRGEPENVV